MLKALIIGTLLLTTPESDLRDALAVPASPENFHALEAVMLEKRAAKDEAERIVVEAGAGATVEQLADLKRTKEELDVAEAASENARLEYLAAKRAQMEALKKFTGP